MAQPGYQPGASLKRFTAEAAHQDPVRRYACDLIQAQNGEMTKPDEVLRQKQLQHN